MAQLIHQLTGEEAERGAELRSFTDRPIDTDFDDLIHSWERLGDPNLRRLAVRFVRMLGEHSPSEPSTRKLFQGITSQARDAASSS